MKDRDTHAHLYLHIGYPKAASTYLQRILSSQNNRRNFERGYLYSRDINLINAQIEGRTLIEGARARHFIYSNEDYLRSPLTKSVFSDA
jgi:hypothetical protein